MKSLKTSIFLFLIVLMSFMGQPLSATNPDPEAANYDDATGYYLISSYANLLWLAQEVNSGRFDESGVNVRLTSNIEANGTDTYNDYYYYLSYNYAKPDPENYNLWTPIGTNGHPFKGNFDGNGYTITNLYYNLDAVKDTCAFICEAENATIHDLTIGHSIFLAKYYCATIVGIARSNVQINRIVADYNVISLTTKEEGFTGSIVAITETSNCSISNCRVCATGTLNYDDNLDCRYGGFVGSNSGTISNSYLSGWGNLDASYFACHQNNAGENSISNCYYQCDNSQYTTESGMSPISFNSIVSGHLCYLLNGSVSGGTDWHQYIGGEPYPGTSNPSEIVYLLDDWAFYNNTTGSGSDPLDLYSHICICEETGANITGTISAEKVTYRRFTNNMENRWHTICVPFKIEASQNTQYKFFMIDNIEKTQALEYIVHLKPVEEIPANTPGFIFKDILNLDIDILMQGSSDDPITIGGNPSDLDFGDFQFRGVFGNTQFNEEVVNTGNYYYVANNGIYHAVNPFELTGYKAYLRRNAVGTGAAPVRLSFDILDEEVTAISDIASWEEDVHPKTDLLGRPVSASAKGLLISNHKKLLAR